MLFPLLFVKNGDGTCASYDVLVVLFPENRPPAPPPPPAPPNPFLVFNLLFNIFFKKKINKFNYYLDKNK